MKKITFGLRVLLLAVVLVSANFTVYAKNASYDGNLPEENGVYDVPGNPHLKLRVFVHKDRGVAKLGQPGPAPVLSCAPSATGDPDSTSTVPGAGWKLPSAWTYRLNTASVPASVGSANLPVIVSNGFSGWLGAIGNTVAVTRGADTRVSRATFDGQNIVTWGRTSGSALAVTYIWYNQTTGVASEIDTIMNSKFTWSWSDPAAWPAGEICAFGGVYDAQSILTHELGHTMGLDDVYTAEFTNNTMYGYGYKAEAKKDTLTIGDVAGVSAIYP
ncbi:MAG: hypothetical protein Q7S36_02070 [Candidatus Liptonbacteria bacterium]|nr:hypothetical protein [Candidatus Liptonbacteria bacterium]